MTDIQFMKQPFEDPRERLDGVPQRSSAIFATTEFVFRQSLGDLDIGRTFPCVFQDGVSGQCQKVFRLVSAKCKLVDDQPYPIRVAFRIETKEKLSPLIGSPPGPAHAEIGGISPCCKPKFPIFRAPEVKASSSFGNGCREA